MSSCGLCPNNICPAMVYVQIIYVQRWGVQCINIYVHEWSISKTLVKSFLIIGEIILKLIYIWRHSDNEAICTQFRDKDIMTYLYMVCGSNHIASVSW